MAESTVEVRESTQDHRIPESSASVVAVPPPPPPRRPRVREVSSRFMSPVASSSSGDLHLLASKSPCPSRQQQQQQRSISAQRGRPTETEPSNCADENIRNSSETPLGALSKAAPSTQGRSRALVKLFKENNGSRSEQQPLPNQDLSRSRTFGEGGKLSVRNGYAFTPSRPDTPTVTNRTATPRSRYLQRSISGPPTATAAAKLLKQSSGVSMSLPAKSSHGSISKANDQMGSVPENHGDGSDENSVQNSLARSLADLRSSTSDADMLPTMSNRLLTERNGNNRSTNAVGAGDSYRFPASPCCRSLNMPLSSCDSNMFSSVRGSEKSTSVVNKSCSNPTKMGVGVCLPPIPPLPRAAADARKTKKVSGQQDDVHSLKLLHNHYMQWRFANAKAAASVQVQKREVERTLVSLRVQMSDMYDSVKRKRVELGILQRTKSLSTIVEAQMPYLEEWSVLEDDYSISLSEVIQALVNTSLQLPISGNVKADTREVGEALNSAAKMLEMISLNAQRFMPKAEEMERLVSELARLAVGEKALVEECGYMLSKTHMSQVQECCLRSQLIQSSRGCHVRRNLEG